MSDKPSLTIAQVEEIWLRMQGSPMPRKYPAQAALAMLQGFNSLRLGFEVGRQLEPRKYLELEASQLQPAGSAQPSV